MQILLILKSIIDSKKIIEELIKFLKFLKKGGFFSIPFFSLIIIFSICLYFLIPEKYDNRIYDNSVFNDDLIKKIDSILLQCGDKVGISISTISLNKNKEENFYNGNFEAVRVCDKRVANCIIDLKVTKSFYNKIQQIDLTSYANLVAIGLGNWPKDYYLRDNENKQDLSSLGINTSLIDILHNTDWYKEEILNTVYIDSILFFKKETKLLYVLTLLTARDQIDCKEPRWLLKDLKNFLLKNYDKN